MVLNGSVLRNVAEGLRRELQYVGHHGEIDLQAPETFRGFSVPQRGQLKKSHATLLGRHPQRIGLRARLFRRTEKAGDPRAAGEEGLEHALAERLLSDDG